jgi:hypothetical protein
VSALCLRIVGATYAHAELNRDPEQVQNESISVANECGNGSLWIERIELATSPCFDREALLKREIMRAVAELRQDPESVSKWESVVELQRKLPIESAAGPEGVKLDTATLCTALDEAEALLFCRLAQVSKPIPVTQNSYNAKRQPGTQKAS